ncbi:hypothetical protein F5Y07DRAFT_296637 [Xylaria sp. FL0933]|nr:hypothetical protein F5Y07DRAFT_296637 [Xylaria sp. FL0933]
MVQDFYQLNGSQQVPRRPDGPPQRPPQGPPGVHPQGYQQAHLQGHPTIPPAPPRNMLPVDLRGGPAVQVSDVTQALFTESDMKEELTDYVVFRFEKMAEKDGLDDQGLPKWPSWEKAIRTEDRSISKQAAAHKIRELNLNTRGVIDKKNSLTSPQKRQLDQTLDYLLKQEPDLANFDWTLAQIDHQLRRIEPYHPGGLNHQYVSTRKHRSSTTYPFVSARPHSRTSNHHHHHSKKKKKAYERVALTAYFKRTPRRGVDIPRLWKEKKRALEGMYQAPAHNAFPHTQSNHTQFPGPQQQQQHQPPPPQQHHGGRQPGPPPLRMPDGNQQGPQMPHPNRPMNHNTRPSNGHHGHGQNRARHSDSESDSGSDSRRSSSAASRRGSQTPPSSVSDHRGGGHQHHKNRHHHHHVGGGSAPNHLRHHTPANNVRPGNAGHRPNGSPRLLPPRPPGPPYPVSSREGGSVASHIEQVREEAFRRGRLAERTDAKLAEELAFSKAHGRPRPHIVQERSPAAARGRRLYNNRGRGGGGGSDDDMLPRYFSRLGLWDDSEDDDDLELRREYERRVQHGSILEGFDPFELNPPSPSSSSYTYSTDGVRGRRRPPIIEIPERHYPLSSPRLRRRMSYHP